MRTPPPQLLAPASVSLAVPAGYSSTNLLLRGVPPSVSDDDLEQAMLVFGELVSHKVMRDIHTGRSLEKAFAQFSTPEAATRAVAHIREQGLFGTAVRVEWAKQKYDNAAAPILQGDHRTVFARNIPVDVTAEQMAAVAAQFGAVEKMTLCEDTATAGSAPRSRRASTRHTQVAFIEYADPSCAALAARTLYNTKPFPSCGDQPVMTKLAESKKERAPRQTGGTESPQPRFTPCRTPQRSGRLSAVNAASRSPLPPQYRTAVTTWVGDACDAEPVGKAVSPLTSGAGLSSRSSSVSGKCYRHDPYSFSGILVYH